eukprot:9078462-Prorocentrum_lima.AAC.1
MKRRLETRLGYGDKWEFSFNGTAPAVGLANNARHGLPLPFCGGDVVDHTLRSDLIGPPCAIMRT